MRATSPSSPRWTTPRFRSTVRSESRSIVPWRRSLADRRGLEQQRREAHLAVRPPAGSDRRGVAGGVVDTGDLELVVRMDHDRRGVLVEQLPVEVPPRDVDQALLGPVLPDQADVLLLA